MKFPFHGEPGYVGAFTRDNAEGALPAGTRIQKTNSERGDSMPNGAAGTVLGSYRDDFKVEGPGILGADFIYFIEWDARKGYAVATSNRKIVPA